MRISNKFIIFFSNVGKNIKNNIVNNGFELKDWTNLVHNCHVNNSMFSTPITQLEIENQVIKIKDYSSHHENGITNMSLKILYIIFLYH